MKKVFFLLTLSLVSISADLTATPKQEALIDGVACGSLIGLAAGALHYIGHKDMVNLPILASGAIAAGLHQGCKSYFKETQKQPSRLTRSLSEGLSIYSFVALTFPIKGIPSKAFAASLMTSVGCGAFIKDGNPFLKLCSVLVAGIPLI